MFSPSNHFFNLYYQAIAGILTAFKWPATLSHLTTTHLQQPSRFLPACKNSGHQCDHFYYRKQGSEMKHFCC